LSRKGLRILAASAAIVASAAFTSSASALAPGEHAGSPTIHVNVGDDVAGGQQLLAFDLADQGTTENGTPVYVYAPHGAVGASTSKGIAGMDPTIDRIPGDPYTPCADEKPEDFVISNGQIQGLTDELAGKPGDPGIVQVDTDHFGPIGEAKPGDASSKALVVLAYNIVDGSYYDCEATQYTVGYFAPQFIDEDGLNVIVIDTKNWDELVGHPDSTDLTIEGVIAHELQHLLHNYSDPGELSWVDEGLADFAIFLNAYPIGGSHNTYHQVFHRETSLTRWGGGLENYGASLSFFKYLWDQAGGNGGGNYAPDQVNNHRNGDRLIQLVFADKADGFEGVQSAITKYNATLQPGETAVRSAAEVFKDWTVADYLDAEGSNVFDVRGLDFGNPATTTWTISLANQEFFGGRDIYKGAVPQAKYNNRVKKGLAGDTTALPYSVSYQEYTNPGPTVTARLQGDPKTQVAPHSPPTHWYAGYQSQSDHVLNVGGAAPGGKTLDFWSWYFIEEGWDYGFVEYTTDGTTWKTVPVTDVASGKVISTNTNPQGNNSEGNGLTGTSGGAYFVDQPKYLHLNAAIPDGAQAVRLRYSTDTAYLDTGWFVDDVKIGTTAATLSSPAGEWFETQGIQDNHWMLQVIAPCDLTPGVTSAGERVDNLGYHVYRAEGTSVAIPNLNTKCLGKRQLTTVISNMPTGDLTFLDAPYTFALQNTGNAK
jgi:hypothetical protein